MSGPESRRINAPLVGHVLRGIREQLKLRDIEVVEKLGFDVRSIESNEREPNLSELMALAQAYSYTPGGLLNRLLKEANNE